MSESVTATSCLSLDDAAIRLSVSRRFLEKHIARGTLHSVKLGRRRVIRERDLVQFIESAIDTRTAKEETHV